MPIIWHDEVLRETRESERIGPWLPIAIIVLVIFSLIWQVYGPKL